EIHEVTRRSPAWPSRAGDRAGLEAARAACRLARLSIASITARRRHGAKSGTGRVANVVMDLAGLGRWRAEEGGVGRTPGGDITDLLGDGHGVVAEALVVSTDQGGVHGLFHAM